MGSLSARVIDELGYDPDDGVPELADVGTIATGVVVRARDGARQVAVARLGSGRLVIVDDACPHDGGPISDGFVDGEHLVCARHGWELAIDQRSTTLRVAPHPGVVCQRTCKLGK